MRIFALSAIACLAATAVHAEPVETLAEGGRYQLMEFNEKVIRLDTETAAFEVCRMEGESWTCQIAKEERLALESRIEELTRRVARLEAARADEVATRETAEAARPRAAAQFQPQVQQPQVHRPLASSEPLPPVTPESLGQGGNRGAGYGNYGEAPQQLQPQIQARPAPAPQAEDKGLVARLYDYVPGLSW